MAKTITTSKKKPKKQLKTERLGIRLTPQERIEIEKNAKEFGNGTDLSKFMVQCALTKKVKIQPVAINDITIVALATELVRHVDKRYSKYEDEDLRRKVDELCAKLL